MGVWTPKIRSLDPLDSLSHGLEHSKRARGRASPGSGQRLFLLKSKVHPGGSHISTCNGREEFGLWGLTGLEMFSSSFLIPTVYSNNLRSYKNTHT